MIQVLLRTCSDEEGIAVEKGATRPFTGNKIRAIMNLDAAPVSQPAQPEASSLFLPSPVGERLLRHRRQKRTCMRRRARCLSSAYPNCSTCLTMASACHYGHQQDKKVQGDATTFYAEGMTKRENPSRQLHAAIVINPDPACTYRLWAPLPNLSFRWMAAVATCSCRAHTLHAQIRVLTAHRHTHSHTLYALQALTPGQRGGPQRP